MVLNFDGSELAARPVAETPVECYLRIRAWAQQFEAREGREPTRAEIEAWPRANGAFRPLTVGRVALQLLEAMGGSGWEDAQLITNLGNRIAQAVRPGGTGRIQVSPDELLMLRAAGARNAKNISEGRPGLLDFVMGRFWDVIGPPRKKETE
jgi:hypothetical protein